MSTDTAVKIDAKLVKELREKSGAPMGDCLKALQEAKGDMEDGVRRPPQARHGIGRQEGLAHHQRGRSRNLHPRRRKDRRPRRAQLRVRLRRPHRLTSRSCSATSPCTSPPPTRATFAARTSPPPTSSARRRSTAPRLQPPASPPTSSRRCSKARWPSSTKRSACSTSRSSRSQSQTIAQIIAHQGRQARREHQRPPLRPLQGRRPQLDRRHHRPDLLGGAVGIGRASDSAGSSSPGDSPGSSFCSERDERRRSNTARLSSATTSRQPERNYVAPCSTSTTFPSGEHTKKTRSSRHASAPALPITSP